VKEEFAKADYIWDSFDGAVFNPFLLISKDGDY